MSTPPRPPTISGYDNLSLIGAGGFSNVFLANQSNLKRQVAIKVLKFGLDDDAKRRAFERETELMARVSMHPNIVPIHDTAFTHSGQPCIVMGHYVGGSLADLLGRARTLSVKEVIEIGIAIASALDASHHAGIVHCDIKPQNILISSYGQLALGDFGISTFADERTRTSDTGIGFTPTYAAPEVIEGETPSVATDLYSLGATLYTALAGHRPFARPTDNTGKVSVAELARRILLDDLTPLGGVPPVLDAAVRTAMSREPATRPDSAAAFASQLYEIGQQLGLTISVPHTRDRAALSRPDSRDDEPAAPVIDPTRLLVAAPTDTGLSDTGLSDTGLSDTGLSDTELSSTGLSDTGLSDTGFSDTGLSDTGLSDTELSSTELVESELLNTAPTNAVLAHTEPSGTVPPSVSSPVAQSPTRPSQAKKVLVAAASLLTIIGLGVVGFVWTSADPEIVGPSTLEAGTSAVYTLPSAQPGTVRWIDWNNEVVIQDAFELTGVLPGVVRFSAVVGDQTHSREVTVERSAQGPSIVGPSSLGVGQSATYTATAPDGATLAWSSSTDAAATGSTFVISQVAEGVVVRVVATDVNGVERGDQLRVEVDG